MKISLASLIATVTGSEKIPTGEVGDKAITVNQIKTFVSPKDATNVNLAATPVVLDMANEGQKRLKSVNNFGSNKNVNISNDTFTRELLAWRFTVDAVGRVLTFEAKVKMPSWDGNWVDGSKQWTAPFTGEYEARGTYDGTTWNLRIEGPF